MLDINRPVSPGKRRVGHHPFIDDELFDMVLPRQLAMLMAYEELALPGAIDVGDLKSVFAVRPLIRVRPPRNRDAKIDLDGLRSSGTRRRMASRPPWAIRASFGDWLTALCTNRRASKKLVLPDAFGPTRSVSGRSTLHVVMPLQLRSPTRVRKRGPAPRWISVC